ncbi:pyroglutamyl-peptidase I [Facklamia sp. DSM 111018]|uniref:Pyrrolidone-carboxylate peptidase n=1 Tax=Facklamia lactis TaxID=2749967 RepID=A0ABS0LRA3_9LACT|nr:pyroglutamyl-peptidase I [Facklamia lactis]MBG9980942.1 pyroglutamyl-peptidase I [Facklamia lactis]MBG9986695.1 pyroglutamyl-peptidase I [Facklamia lactis]
MKILVTGFDPFGGEAINPAIEAVKMLPNEIAGAEIIKLEIPTVFHKSADVMRDLALQVRPDVILNIGQAGGRTALTPERVAINMDDARIEDNDGNQPIDQPIQADGPSAYFSTLPVKAMADYIAQAGLPAQVSNTAGTFVCNHIMYQSLYLAERELPGTRAGFMHIPFMTEQVVDKAQQPSMSLKDIVTGIEKAIEAIVDFEDQEDIKLVGGTTH